MWVFLFCNLSPIVNKELKLILYAHTVIVWNLENSYLHLLSFFYFFMKSPPEKMFMVEGGYKCLIPYVSTIIWLTSYITGDACNTGGRAALGTGRFWQHQFIRCDGGSWVLTPSNTLGREREVSPWRATNTFCAVLCQWPNSSSIRPWTQRFCKI